MNEIIFTCFVITILLLLAILARLMNNDKPRNRLPIISKEGLPLHVLHRSTLDGYVTAQLIESLP
ncbi:MAG: hypothetical protein ACOYMG_23185 [Candidatus Methylumidiphilus sp.]